MKPFEKPEIELIKLKVDDVITSSPDDEELGENELPPAVRP